MIIQDDNGNITLSYGDTLAIKFKLNKPISTGDTAVLVISNGTTELIKQTITNKATNELSFVVSATNMTSLGEGTYYYDMHIDFADGRVFTTNWRRKIKLKGVAHNVNNH